MSFNQFISEKLRKFWREQWIKIGLFVIGNLAGAVFGAIPIFILIGFGLVTMLWLYMPTKKEVQRVKTREIQHPNFQMDSSWDQEKLPS